MVKHSNKGMRLYQFNCNKVGKILQVVNFVADLHAFLDSENGCLLLTVYRVE